MTISRITVAISAIFTLIPIAQGQQKPVKKIHTKSTGTTIITSNSTLPVVTFGATKIVIEYVNPLHYQYSLQVISTNITAPTPPAVIAPSSSTSGTLQAANSPQTEIQNPPQPSTIDGKWQALLANFAAYRQTAFGLKQQTDGLWFLASMEQQCYKDRLSFFSAFLLDENSASLLRHFTVNNRTPASGMSSTSASDSCRRSTDTWPYPALQNVEKQIYALQSDLLDLSTTTGFAAWKAIAPNADNYTAVTTQVANLLTQVQSLEASSDLTKNFLAAQVYNTFWRTRIEEIARSEDDINEKYQQLEKNPSDIELKAAYDASAQRSPFLKVFYINCSTNWYGRGRTDTVTIHYTDITATSPTDQNTQIATSSCMPPGTVSTGIGLSFLHNAQYAFVSGRDPNTPANTISVIGTTTDQRVTPLYSVQYNIAIRDFSSGAGFHATVGAALGSSSGTANIELITGPSLSIRRRAFFITPAFQLGRRESLLPGYSIGDAQGNGLTSVPVNTSWKPGFALIFSFSVAQ